MKNIYYYIIGILCLPLLSACEDYYDTKNDPITYGDTYLEIKLTTDKACYKPGETVQFSLKERVGNSPKVRYSYLGEVLKEENLSGTSWSWTTPSDDFKGYMVDIYEKVNGVDVVYESVGIDVSSDWKKFPRYGFLSGYGNKSDKEIQKTMDVLNRYHINGIQFYDWLSDHQRPLEGTVQNPADSWTDLIGRTNYMSTSKNYINSAHSKGMKTMYYNLCFGALNNAAADGVKEEWYIFKDANRTEKDKHQLDAPFRSSIYLTNPANAEWQNYMAQSNKDVYSVYAFDGYHIDQLGDRGTVYDYNGQVVKLDETYKPFIAAMKIASPDKRLLFNAVNQFGQEKSIAKSEVDFLYTEVWDPNKSFEQLAQVIQDNNTYSNNTKNTVLAAYVNYDKSKSFGYMNAPGVLLANAVMFSFGGSHIEMGEHYLANEYYPNSNLQMKADLKSALINYYDFLVAYQNLLRDGGVFAPTNIQSTDDKVSIANWPADKGSVAAIGKRFANRDIVHLINFTDANSMEWRDTNGTQKEAKTMGSFEVKIPVTKTVSKVWFASPDSNGGVSQSISFVQTGNDISITLPSLKYWDMVVVEY